MCGFIFSSGKNIIRNWVDDGIKLLQHRGPDYTGSYFSKNIETSHCRLAIIDLDQRSNQPMVSDTGTILLFNGEIFNYKDLRKELIYKGVVFKTNSDTEVILNGFLEEGKDFITKLNGQFAISIITNQSIYLFRDPSGQKPIYYSILDKTLYVASELSPFYSFNDNLNEQFIQDYLENGFSKESPFKNVHKLPQGNCLEFDRKKNELKDVTKYHEYEIDEFLSNISRHDIQKQLTRTLIDSVNRHSIADVKVGLLLSGGIDSSLLASLLPSSKNITCFTVDFGDNLIELENAKAIARHYRLELEIVPIKEKLNFEEYKEIVASMKEPIGDSSYLAVYIITKKIKELDIKVVLTGDGADELFAGYSLYRNLRVIYNFPKIIRLLVSKIIQLSPIKNRKIVKWGNACETLNKKQHPNLRSFFNKKEIENLTNRKYIDKSLNSFSSNLIKNFMLLDLNNYLSEGLLFKNDCASMCNSIELRAPFLDIEVQNFCLKNLSEEQLLNKNRLKSILKDITQMRFPESYKFDKKRGFNFVSSMVNEKFKQDALQFINTNLKSDKNLIDLLNIHFEQKDSWSFYRFHLLFTLMAWQNNINV